MPDPVVENLPVTNPVPAINPEYLESHRKMSEAMARNAVAAEALAGVGDGGKEERFVRILCACINGRVSTTVEGFLTFARELCDGVDREFPQSTSGA